MGEDHSSFSLLLLLLINVVLRVLFLPLPSFPLVVTFSTLHYTTESGLVSAPPQNMKIHLFGIPTSFAQSIGLSIA